MLKKLHQEVFRKKMTKLEIETSKFFNGTFAKGKGINKVKIVEPEPRMVVFTDQQGKSTKKVQCSITYTGKELSDPTNWTMNKTTSALLAEVWNTDESSEWVGKIVPIEVVKTSVGLSVMVDEDAIGTANEKKAESTQEGL
jgi:hypothetical protein